MTVGYVLATHTFTSIGHKHTYLHFRNAAVRNTAIFYLTRVFRSNLCNYIDNVDMRRIESEIVT